MSEEWVSLRDFVIHFGDDGSCRREEAQALAPLIARAIGLGERETLSVLCCAGLDGRVTEIHCARSFAGVPVEPGDVLIDLGTDGRIVEATSMVSAPIELSAAVPSLSYENAERIMRELVAAAELPVFGRESWVLERTDLQVFGRGCPARLVWNSMLTAPDVTSLFAHILLDAHSGEVVTSWMTGCFTGPRWEPFSLLPPG
jgi:hypothetical protein